MKEVKIEVFVGAASFWWHEQLDEKGAKDAARKLLIVGHWNKATNGTTTFYPPGSITRIEVTPSE